MSDPERIEIPLFPLPNVVLFPGVYLPLHIFEDRYKKMINTCVEEDSMVGIVLLTDKQETPSTIERVGVLARVSQVERLEDGRMNIMTEGEVRFRVVEFTASSPAWRARVEVLADEFESPEEIASLGSELGQSYLEAYGKGLELNGERPGKVELPTSAAALSFMVAYVLNLSIEEKQGLLENVSVSSRLGILIEYLKHANERLTEQVRVKRTTAAARGNGNLGPPHRGTGE